MSDLLTDESYDPESTPNPGGWLDLDEGLRMHLVEAYHRRKRIRLPNALAHAAIHVIVENQCALGEKVVSDTLTRLCSDRLSRHDAIHAVGNVLARHLHDILGREGSDPTTDPNERYFQELRALTSSTCQSAIRI